MKTGSAAAVRKALSLEAAIEQARGLRHEIGQGLDLLARGPRLWPVDGPTWEGVVASVVGFAERWDGQAHAAGWSDIELFGLHRFAAYANLSGMGAAFLAARGGYAAIAVDPAAILVRSQAGSVLRIRRLPLVDDAVLAWKIPGCANRLGRGAVYNC